MRLTSFFLGLFALSAMAVATPTAGTAAQGAADYAQVYGGILDDFHTLIISGSDEHISYDGATGVMEIARLGGDALGSVGYAVLDLSGDGIPELLIGAAGTRKGFEDEGSEIYAVYSCAGGAPRCVLEGWARNSYRLMEDGLFFNRSSNGAMYSIFGTYALSRDGGSLTCKDYYFSFEKDKKTQKIGFYHNTSGKWDKSVSRELKISEKKFRQTEAKLAKQTRHIKLTLFSEYETSKEGKNAAEPPLRVQEAEGALSRFSAYDLFTASSSEPRVRVLFSTENSVRDFKVLALSFEDIDEKGKMKFAVKELHSLDRLAPERPLVVEMTFYGSIPNNGVSYVDQKGARRRFTVEQSGEDGALFLREF